MRRSMRKKNYGKRVVRAHVLPWTTWLDRLPSLNGLNRKDVRALASATPGDFPLATGYTSYVSSIEMFKLRRQLRSQALLKKQLFELRTELIHKTHGWLLDDSGAVRVKNAPGSNIQMEVDRIAVTLRIFDERSVNIDKALREMQEKFQSMKAEAIFSEAVEH